MYKRINYNYYIKLKEKIIYISLIFYKNELTILSYNNGEVEIEVYNNIKIKNGKIIINDIEFSNEFIKYKYLFIKLQRSNKSKFNDNILLFKFNGNYYKEHIDGTLYFDVEKFINIPLEYTKILSTNVNNYDGIYSFSNYEFLNKSRSLIYIDYNEMNIKEKEVLFKKKRNNIYLIKTFDYIYNFSYLTKQLNNTNCKKIKIGKCNFNLELSKQLSNYKLKFKDEEAILITYKL